MIYIIGIRTRVIHFVQIGYMVKKVLNLVLLSLEIYTFLVNQRNIPYQSLKNSRHFVIILFTFDRVYLEFHSYSFVCIKSKINLLQIVFYI